MTGAQTLAAFRRALVPALAVGLGVLGLVVVMLLSRPASYSARVGVVAAPSVSNASIPNDFGAVVTLTMQALPELAVSDGTLSAIRADVPRAPAEPVLRKAITVELVPGSSVARLSVVADSAETATAVLKSLLVQVRKADLLAPVGELKPIGTGTPTTQQVEHDPRLALGLGLVAGLIASLVAVVLVQALRPRLLTVPDVEQVVEEVFGTSGEVPPVVALDDDEQGLSLLAAHLLAQKPVATEVTVVPAGTPLREDLAPQLRNALRNLRVARDAGLPVGPSPASRSSTRPSEAWLTPTLQPAPGAGQDPAVTMPAVTVPADGQAVATASAVGARRPGLFAPMGSPGDGRLDLSAAGAPNALSHLVVTVRLGGTTPTALITALVALRTHGTGIAGVAVG